MCGHRHPPRRVSDLAREDVFARNPDMHMRASQEERDRTVDLLREQAGAGRLELEELEQRVEAALAARTRGELAQLTADLPADRRPRRRTPERSIATGLAAVAFLPLLAGIAILVLAPAAFAWVGWTAIGWWFFAGSPSGGFGFARCGHARRRRAHDTVVV